MMKFTVLVSALLAVTDAATTVSVLEFGSKGSVRRTTSNNKQTTVAGVASFWNSMQGKGLQQTDMTVVPDLFNKPSGIVVVGISGSGVDLEAMPTLSDLVNNEGLNNVVGHMELPGAHSRHLLNKVGPSKQMEVDSMISTIKAEAATNKISSVNINVDGENAASVDAQIAAMLKAMQEHAGDKSIVVHLVVEEEEGAARRRLLSDDSVHRRLEDQNNNNNNGDNNGDNNNENGNNNGYYGYGYYNSYGEWVTPYKTMFQIQYFNLVLWTSVGLFIVIFFTIYLVVNMPLEADTLLFGESAKMMGD